MNRTRSSTRLAAWAFGTLAIVWALTGTAGAQGLGFPLVVDNPLDYDRTDVPVATGMSLPHNAELFDLTGIFALVDDTGTPVPVQTKVLSRWGGTRDDMSKAVKWALSIFNATVPANSSRTYYIQAGTPLQGQITINDQLTSVQVNTGPADFKISKQQFRLFDEVKIGGALVTGGPGALAVRDVLGGAAQINLLSTVVEEPGTVRTVIRQKGQLPELGLDFTVRYFFYTGHSEVKVEFRLENKGNYGELAYLGNSVDHAHFEDLKLVVKMPTGSAVVQTSTSGTNIGSNDYSLEQAFGQGAPLNMLSGFIYTEAVNQIALSAGERSDGAIALNTPNGSVGVAVDRFWQNFPKAFEVSNNELSIALFPAFGNGPVFSGQYGTLTSPPIDALSTSFYRFEGGRWKTHTMTFDFQGAGQPFDSATLATKSIEVNNPLHARPPLDWDFKNFALGDLVMERREWGDVGRQRYERMMDVLHDDGAADNQPALGRIGFRKFRNRGGTYGGDQMFGWENFGDVAWGDGYSSNHYDLPYGILVNYLRTGDYGFFDVARDMVAHRRDYDTVHTTHASSVRRGGQSYEKGIFHGNYQAPTPSHTWVHGQLLYYVLTGDEGAREAAIETGEFYIRMNPQTWGGWWGSRILGWNLEGLMNLYNYIGDPQYASVAQQTVQNWDFLDAQSGLDGIVPNPAWSTPHAQTWMHAIVLNAICKYHMNTGDLSALPVISRLADFMRDQVILTDPAGPSTNRTVAKVWGRVGPGGFESDVSGHHVWVTSQALSMASIATLNPTYMAAATRLFDSQARYYQLSSGPGTLRNYDDPNTYSAIAFRMMNFPNSESKVMSNIALWGQAYLMARTLWDDVW